MRRWQYLTSLTSDRGMAAHKKRVASKSLEISATIKGMT
jgi:hypothetical protein